jgi:hypothetical protein
LTSIRALFNEKEKELSMAAAQVEDLTRQLEQFSAQAHHAQAHPGSKAYFVQLHLERLRAELMVLLYIFILTTSPLHHFDPPSGKHVLFYFNTRVYLFFSVW